MVKQTGLLGEGANLAELVAQMSEPNRALYKAYRALSIQAAFDERIFIIYQPTGLNTDGTHRHPKVLTTLRCLGFFCDSQEGCLVQLQNDATGDVEEITYVPRRPFGLEVFMSIPPSLRIDWDARPVGGSVKRNMAYALLVKTRSRSDWYSAGATMCETPKQFKALYPSVSI